MVPTYKYRSIVLWKTMVHTVFFNIIDGKGRGGHVVFFHTGSTL